MEIGTRIIIRCGKLSAGARPGVEALAKALGASVYEDRTKYTCLPETIKGKSNLVSVTVMLRTNLECGDELIVCQEVIDPRDLASGRFSGDRLEISIKDYADALRERLVAALGGFVAEQVRESLTPPPLYAETGIYFQRQKVFLASTGNRATDKHMVDAFDRYIGKRLYHEV